MTKEQAIEIREHLIHELNSTGFSNIVIEVNTRLQENYEKEEFQKDPIYLLDFFLRESIEVLDSLSNKNFQNLLKRFNEVTIGNKKVKSIFVELLDQGEPISFDLNNLPDYKEIIKVLNEVLLEIRKEN